MSSQVVGGKAPDRPCRSENRPGVGVIAKQDGGGELVDGDQPVAFVELFVQFFEDNLSFGLDIGQFRGRGHGPFGYQPIYRHC